MGENNEVVMVDGQHVEERERVKEEELNWGDVLPKRVVRVLLVEADDCTRHLITALLRKCNYKVAAISDGLKAWEFLKRRHNKIDIILTEHDLPSISGYALLTLIMEHGGCKNIPVIIMSSEDSISMVLKCMLKGAADFLIKPIRKNELKNLWRHVWRRIETSAGHNPQDLATEQHKVEANFEMNPATNHSSDNISTSRKTDKNGEKATDAQSSSGTPILVAESENMENMLHHSGVKCGDESGLSHKETKYNAPSAKTDNEMAPQTSVVGDKIPILDSGCQACKEIDASSVLKIEKDGSCTGISTEDASVDLDNHQGSANAGFEYPQYSREAIDLIGSVNKQKRTAGQISSSGEHKILNATPELELSLRRAHDSEAREVDEKDALNHSCASAFSWYNSNKKSRTSVPSSVDELIELKGIADSLQWPKMLRDNKECKPTLSPQIGDVPSPGAVFDGGVWTGYAPMFQPTLSSHVGKNADPLARSPNIAIYRENSPVYTSTSLHSDQGTHSSTINHSSGQAVLELKTRESVERQGCSSSNVVDPSGSNTPCGDTSQNKISACGSTSDLTNVNATSPGMTGTSAVENVLRDEGCNTFDTDKFRYKTSHHSAEREAALAKFRLKRKGRCYEKKVRYQSRKRLAEQRPRVKGQFVRQVPTDQVAAAVDKKVV